jgi:hypothetical protein
VKKKGGAVGIFLNVNYCRLSTMGMEGTILGKLFLALALRIYIAVGCACLALMSASWIRTFEQVDVQAG